MHPCLLIPEIRLAIFKPLKNPALAVLARTCKDFHDPAITLLWEDSRSLAHLIRVMPSGLWEEKRMSTEGKTIVFKRPLQDNDWERLDHYGCKIRHLCIAYDLGFSETVLAHFSAHRPVKYLLPRLLSIDIYFNTYGPRSSIKYIPCLFGESLRQLTVTAIPMEMSDQDQAYIRHFLASIARCCPDITHLCLRDRVENLHDPQEGFSLSNFIGSFLNLHTLTLSYTAITPSLISQLGRMNKLRSLSFDGLYCELGSTHTYDKLFGDLSTNPLFSSQDSGLSCLEVESLRSADIQFLLNVAPSTLERFISEDGEGLANFAQLIDPLHRFVNMTSITLSYHDYQFPRSTAEPPSLSALLPLQNLKYVVIRGLPNEALTDRWLEQISDAWPRLSVLEAIQRTPDTPLITLAGLIPVVYKCKSLTHITIGAQCRPFDLAKVMFEHRVSNVEELHFRCSVLEQPWQALRCILLLFPRLRMATVEEDEEDIEGDWQELDTAFKRILT